MNIDKPHANLMAVMYFLFYPDIKPTLRFLPWSSQRKIKRMRTYFENII
jgi:hypothetical protein